MPTLSIFFGIIVKMYDERKSKHNLPHIHAEYNGEEVVIDLEGNVITGNIPIKKLRLLLAWVEIHKEDISANYETYQQTGEYFRIDPLR